MQLSGRANLLWDIDDPRDETGGTGRYWEFDTERWVQIDHANDSRVLDYPVAMALMSLPFVLGLGGSH